MNLISFEVKLPSACSFIVDGLTFRCRCSTLHVSAETDGRRQLNLKTYWTIQCSRMLKYNNMNLVVLMKALWYLCASFSFFH
jgi:hypothetical protein